MDQICLVVPIRPGRTADARDFMRELEAGHNADYRRAVLYQRRGSGLFPCVALRRARRAGFRIRTESVLSTDVLGPPVHQAGRRSTGGGRRSSSGPDGTSRA